MGRNSGGTKPGPGDLGEGDSGYRGSITNIQSLVHMVVNCFQISNFVLWQTARFVLCKGNQCVIVINRKRKSLS